MQISQLITKDFAASESAVAQTLPSPVETRAAVQQANTPAIATPPLRRGLSNLDPQLNQQLANAQQALDFLDQASSKLLALKSDLSAKLATRQPIDSRLGENLRQFSQLWQGRKTASGGSLDSQLTYSEAVQPRQRFKIRGLNMRSLQSVDKETLSFSVSGLGQRLLPVSIEPGLSQSEIVRKFNQALAPAGIRAALDEQGELSFSVPESSWLEVRDSLAVKGAGIRFPSGQLNRVRIDAEPEVIRPDTWRADDAAAMRRTLQDVISALDFIRQARNVVSRTLAEVHNNLEQSSTSNDLSWAQSFATDFEAITHEPGYRIFSVIAPALDSVSRNRVLSLLSLN